VTFGSLLSNVKLTLGLLIDGGSLVMKGSSTCVSTAHRTVFAELWLLARSTA
jgi:hypothetical protein